MNIAIAFLAGCVTFVLMMFIKIPIKILTGKLADRIGYDEDDCHVLYKRLNGVIILMAIIVATMCYYVMYCVLEVGHFKLCCSLKAGMIAIALYAAYEQWFGEE